MLFTSVANTWTSLPSRGSLNKYFRFWLRTFCSLIQTLVLLAMFSLGSICRSGFPHWPSVVVIVFLLLLPLPETIEHTSASPSLCSLILSWYCLYFESFWPVPILSVCFVHWNICIGLVPELHLLLCLKLSQKVFMLSGLPLLPPAFKNAIIDFCSN